MVKGGVGIGERRNGILGMRGKLGFFVRIVEFRGFKAFGWGESDGGGDFRGRR